MMEESTTTPTEEAILRELDNVLDPEVPVSIMQLGLVESAEVEGERILIRLIPTMLACPGRSVIAADIRERLGAAFGACEVVVRWETGVVWTPRRISADGRGQLQRWGVVATTPLQAQARRERGAGGDAGGDAARLAAITCPYCGSDEVRRDNAFGAAVCKAQFSCLACRSSFDVLRGSLVCAPAGDDTGRTPSADERVSSPQTGK